MFSVRLRMITKNDLLNMTDIQTKSPFDLKIEIPESSKQMLTKTQKKLQLESVEFNQNPFKDDFKKAVSITALLLVATLCLHFFFYASPFVVIINTFFALLLLCFGYEYFSSKAMLKEEITEDEYLKLISISKINSHVGRFIKDRLSTKQPITNGDYRYLEIEKQFELLLRVEQTQEMAELLNSSHTSIIDKQLIGSEDINAHKARLKLQATCCITFMVLAILLAIGILTGFLTHVFWAVLWFPTSLIFIWTMLLESRNSKLCSSFDSAMTRAEFEKLKQLVVISPDAKDYMSNVVESGVLVSSFDYYKLKPEQHLSKIRYQQLKEAI